MRDRFTAVRPGGCPPPDLALVVPGELDWQDRGLCAQVDAALFHPEKGGTGPAAALRVCAACEVRARCLEWALETGQRWGVLGGTAERERRKMIAARNGKDLAA